MQHPSSATDRLASPPHASWADNRVSNETLAWFGSRLRWERRLAELRTQAERANGPATPTKDPLADAGARRRASKGLGRSDARLARPLSARRAVRYSANS